MKRCNLRQIYSSLATLPGSATFNSSRRLFENKSMLDVTVQRCRLFKEIDVMNLNFSNRQRQGLLVANCQKQELSKWKYTTCSLEYCWNFCSNLLAGHLVATGSTNVQFYGQQKGVFNSFSTASSKTVLIENQFQLPYTKS